MARDYASSSNIIYNPVEAEKKRHSSSRDYRKSVGESGSRDYRTGLANAEQKKLSDAKAFQSLPNLNQSINNMNNVAKVGAPTPMQIAQMQTQLPTLSQGINNMQQWQKDHPMQETKAKGVIQKIADAERAVTNKLGLTKPGPDKQEFTSYYDRMKEQNLHPGNVGNFLGGALDSATFGLQKRAEQSLYGTSGYDPDTKEAKVGSVVGMFAAPGAGQAMKLGAKIIPATGRIAGVARTAIQGALMGDINQAGREAVDIGFGGDLNPMERVGNIGVAGIYGAGANLAFAGGGKVIKAIADKTGLSKALGNIFKRNGVPEEQAQEILALPMGREDAARMRRAPQNGTDPITTPYTFGLPEPRVNAPVPTTARIEQRVNPYREKYNQLIGLAHETKFTPGRESEELEQLWSSMAGKNDPSLDELVKLAHPTYFNKVSPGLVSKAKQYQASREVAGAPLPIRSAEQVPRGVLSQAAPIEQRIGRAPGREPLRTEPTMQQPESIPAAANPIEAEAEQIVNAVKQPRVRDRVYNYLDEAEKAARQRMAKRRGNLNSNPLPEWGDMTIIAAAKIGKGSIKLADFTEEMVKEFGEGARNLAPKLFRAGKEELRKQERIASKEGVKAKRFNEVQGGNADTFKSKIDRKPGKRSKGTFAQRYEKIRTQLIDDLAPLEGLEKRIKGGISSAESSLYKTARNTKGIPEKAHQIVSERLSPIVRDIEKAGYTGEELGDFALAKHAQDVNAAGYKSGFTDAEIQDVLNKYGSPEMNKAQQDLVKVNRDMLDELVNTGVVSNDLRDVLNERWKNYIPLFRSFEDEAEGFAGGIGKALANVASPIKTLKGSERAVIDPLENMVKSIFQSVSASERNKVGTQLAALSKRDADNIFIRKLDPDEQVGRKNVVNVKENGENVKYEVEPAVYKSLLDLDKESGNILMDVLSKPASLLRAGATLTPDFAIRNPIRDINQAFITSKSGFNPIVDFPIGLIQSITKGKWAKEWIDNNGSYGNVLSSDRNVHKEALEKVLKQPASKKVINIVNPKAWVRVLRYISDTTESATKIGEYRKAIKQGQTPQEAAYRSRDLMDFARAGSGVRQANRVVAFLNANIQGKSKLLRAIKENPVKVTARAFTSVTVPTIGIYIMNREYANETQKRTIAEAPDWQKDAFWLIAVPGTDTVARLPKPFDVAALFANLPERAMQFIDQNDPTAMDGFVKRSLSESALPYQLSGLLPIVEGMANYSFFRQGGIIPQREEGLQYKDQYDPVRTTEAAKLFASGASKLTGDRGPFKNFSSPRIVDNTIQGFTAGGGKYITDAIDIILQKTGVVDRPVAPEKRSEQLPLVRSFLVDPLQSTKSMDKLYSNKEQLSREKASNKLNDVKFPTDKQKELNSLSSATGKMSAINKKIREIEASKTMSAKEKRDRIEPLLTERNTISMKAVKK